MIYTRVEDGIGADVGLYQRDSKPCYYIDLMGADVGIAALVADDFPALIATLKEIHPLLTLIRLDQANNLHTLNALNQERRSSR